MIALPRPTTQKKPRSLASNVRSGAMWNIASTMLFRLGSIGVTAVVARLLGPHDFGVFAVAMTVFTIVQAFGEFGVTSCLARADLDEDALAPTLWTASLTSSLLIAGLIYTFAEPIAASLGSRDAAHPVQVMALVLVIWGAGAVPTGQCVREFRQDRLFLANAVSYVPSTVVLLLMAEHGSGAMAFAWSRVVGQAISCAVVFISVPKWHFPGLTRDALSVLFRYGLPLACASFVGYILQNVDYALIGRFVGAAMLGTYVVAFNAASWSSTLLGSVLNSVTMPAFSRVKEDSAKLKAVMADGLCTVVLIASPICALSAVLARPIILTLYGGRWATATEVLSTLALYGLISVMGMLFASVLSALGKSKFVLAIQLIWIIGLVPAMYVGIRLDGIVGAAIAHVIIICPLVFPCYLIALKRATGVQIAVLARITFHPLVAAGISAFLAWLATLPFSNPFIQLAAGGMLGGISYIAIAGPRLFLLLARQRAMPARVAKVLRIYYHIGRTIGIRVGPVPRHAAGRNFSIRRRKDDPTSGLAPDPMHGCHRDLPERCAHRHVAGISPR